MGNDVVTGLKRQYSLKISDKYKIGEGTYGAVYKIKTADTKEVCAAKIFKIPVQQMSFLEQQGYYRELKILQEASHPFVVKYMEEF
jgi:serine/threonine protein kinase